MRLVDPAPFAGVDIAVPALAGAEEAVHRDQRHHLRLQVRPLEAAGPERPDAMGRRIAGGQQGLRLHEADVAVASSLAPGPAVGRFQDVEPLAEQQLVLPLRGLVGRAEDPGGRQDTAHGLHGGEPLRMDQALQPLVGEIGPGQQGAGIGAHP